MVHMWSMTRCRPRSVVLTWPTISCSSHRKTFIAQSPSPSRSKTAPKYSQTTLTTFLSLATVFTYLKWLWIACPKNTKLLEFIEIIELLRWRMVFEVRKPYYCNRNLKTNSLPFKLSLFSTENICQKFCFHSSLKIKKGHNMANLNQIVFTVTPPAWVLKWRWIYFRICTSCR